MIEHFLIIVAILLWFVVVLTCIMTREIKSSIKLLRRLTEVKNAGIQEQKKEQEKTM